MTPDEIAKWNENWRTFRKHLPVGAYLPVGQLDGDCRSCGGSWPCQTIVDVIEKITPTDAQAEGWRALIRERNSWARQMADLRDKRDDAREKAEEWRSRWNQLDNDRTNLTVNLEMLAEELEVDEAGFVGHALAVRLRAMLEL